MVDTSFKIGLVGDIALTHDYDVLHGAKGPHYPFELMRKVFSEHDLLIGNLEAPLCLGGEPYPMKLSLKTHPGYAVGLKEAGFTALTLGNNHIMDYREQAFYDTIEILDSQGIHWCGAGKDLAEARKPVIMEKNGISIGMLSCCEVKIDSPFYASEETRGIAPLDLDQLNQDIASLKGNADIVIVSLHWGIEDWAYPTPDQVEKAHRIIEMGAHLVIGHHPHVLQGIERYKHGYIAYSLGNFLFSDVDWRWVNAQGEVRHSQLKLNSSRKLSAVFSASVSKSGIRKVRMMPCKLRDDLRIVPVDDSPSFKLRMNTLSEPIRLIKYNKFWTLYDTIKTGWVYFLSNAKRIKNFHKLFTYPGKLARTYLESEMKHGFRAHAQDHAIESLAGQRNNIIHFGKYNKRKS